MPTNTAPQEEFDIADLLFPIAGKSICGQNLRYTDVYDAIREARREEDASLSQGVWATEIKRAEWEAVVTLCTDALINRSKDLQIAAWLSEAWLHLEGMDGLVRGIQLIHQLCNEYWEGLYPNIEKDNYELRVGPFEWMNTKLSDEIQNILITIPAEAKALPFTYNQWQNASRNERLTKAQEAAGSQPDKPGKSPSLAAIVNGIERTPTAFFAHLDQACLEAAKALNALEDDLRERLGSETPSFFKIREKIDLISHFARAVLEERGEAQKKAKESERASKMKVNPTRIGKLESREQAYAQLEVIAAYLTKIEPHSPTPYLIRRAIKWGGMSLNEVLGDLIGQNQDTKTLLYLLDIHGSHGNDD